VRRAEAPGLLQPDSVRFSSRYEATPFGARLARYAVVSVAEACGFYGEPLFDIETAVGEALTNAIEHGNKLRGRFLVSASYEHGRLTVEVRDAGAGFSEAERDESVEHRGFGIVLMRALVDRISFHDGGRCVRLEKRLVSPRE
jgi:serine/threonine-protein kinase RsbW